jgi:Mn2+/Fe2+ NRAMP family transporter
MTYDKAQGFIALATVVTLGSTTTNVLKKPKGQKENLKAHRVIAGGFFAMMGCLIFIEFNLVLVVTLAGMFVFFSFAYY